MNEKEIRERAHRFFFTYVSIFLFIHLGIILQTQNQTEYFISIKEAQDLHKIQQKELEGRLYLLESKEVKIDLRDKLIKLKESYIELERKKNEQQKFTLPFIGTSLDQTLILILYPTFAFIGLLAILWLRHQYLTKIPAPYSHPPILVFPLPFKKCDDITLTQWIFLNWLSLLIPILVIYLVQEFYFQPTSRDINTTQALTIHMTLLLIVLTLYIATILNGILFDIRSGENEQ